MLSLLYTVLVGCHGLAPHWRLFLDPLRIRVQLYHKTVLVTALGSHVVKNLPIEFSWQVVSANIPTAAAEV